MSAHQTAEKGLRINQTVTVTGIIRTVETLTPDGHYRITLDVDLSGTPLPPDSDQVVTA